MDLQEYDYYEANAADVNLEQVTSSAGNAKILQRLRDGDRKLTCLLRLNMQPIFSDFIIREGDDLGWLGYFIGQSPHLESLHIRSMPEGEGGEQQIDAFVKGIAQNKSIREVYIEFTVDDVHAAIARAVSNYSQLERLWINCDGSFGPSSHSALGNLLELGVCSLRELCLWGNAINDDVLCSFVNGFKSISASLEVLVLSASSFGNEGLMAVVAGLANSTSLKKLHLSKNDLSLAAVGLSSLSAWLHSSLVTLEHLDLERCQINDEGLQAFAQGSGIHCRELILKGNRSITATGLRCVSNSLQSQYCQVEILDLRNIPSAIGNDGAKALARGLAHNTSLKRLHLVGDSDDTAPLAQWPAFSNALCDPSSVNSTYRSNHTIQRIIFCPEDIDLYLRLNKQHPKHAARCKILMMHTHIDMGPFLQWDLKLLPVALTWFEQAKTCATLNVQLPAVERRIVEESDKEFESRVLSAMYEFVRGMSMQVMGSRNALELTVMYDGKTAKPF